MPTEGLTFYHPLNAYTLNPTVGNTLTLTGNAPAATTFNGIDCLHFVNGALIQDGIDGYIDFTEPEVTMSIWANSVSSSTYVSMFALGAWNNYQAIEILRRYGFLMVSLGTPDRDMTGTITNNRWYHLAFTFFKSGSNYVVRIYRDGAFINQYTQNGSAYNIQKCLGIGRNFSGSGYPDFRDGWFPGYLAGARIYNRALADEEIALLATELTPHYAISASNLSFSLYQKNETYSISYSSIIPVTFEIIEGELPSTITFNTSTGEFTGKGLTDADHTYNLKVRLTAPNSDPVICNVTIHTYKTARISMNNQTFNFISNKAENFAISYTSDEAVTFSIESGTLPAGMTFSSGRFYAAGTNTSAETTEVVVRATSATNQTGVTATMTLNMQMNAIVCNAQTFKFYTEQGVKSKAVVYSGSLNAVSDAVFAMTGTLPTGVTFDATTGTFTSDGTQTADETTSVSVTISSSNGTSTSATATITLEVHEGAMPIPDDYVFYAPLIDASATADETGNYTLTNNGLSNDVVDGIACLLKDIEKKCILTNFKVQDITPSTGTYSVWVYTNRIGNETSTGIYGPYQPGYFQGGFRAALDFTDSYTKSAYNITIRGDSTGRFWSSSFSYGAWHNLVFTFTSNSKKMYVDGVCVGTSSTTYQPHANGNFTIGSAIPPLDNASRESYFTSFRIYDRVLEDDEIATLASEFTPTT